MTTLRELRESDYPEYLRRKRLTRTHGKESNRGRKARLVHSARTRARQKGLICTISVRTLDWPSFCPILGTPLIYEHVGNRNELLQENLPSLDRIIPGLGYTPENTAVISAKANSIKNEGTAEQHDAVARFIRYRLGLGLPQVKS